MKHWTKKYWLALLTVLCPLLLAGCSSATTTSQTTTQETTVAQNETLDGTWELTDVKLNLNIAITSQNISRIYMNIFIKMLSQINPNSSLFYMRVMKKYFQL